MPDSTSQNASTVASPRVTSLSIAALAIGLASGMLLHGSTAPWVAQLSRLLEPLGTLWVRALGIVVFPLIVSLSVLAVLDTPEIGRLGGRSVAVFAAMLLAGAALTCVVAPVVVRFYDADPGKLAALAGSTAAPNEIARASAGGASAWLERYVPRSIGAVVRGAWVLVVLVAAMLAAVILRTVAGSRATQLHAVVRWVAYVTQRVVGWIILVSPLGILALGFALGLRAGARAAGFMAAVLVIVPAVLLLFVAALYPVTSLLARVPIGRFARAAAPAQLVAATTQSSLAALPALVAGARDQLGLPVSATGFVLPLAVSIFKFNRTVSGPTQLFLLVHAFGVELAPVSLALFLLASFLQSFFTPGIPGASTPYFTLPLYVAAGAPAEGVIMLATLDPVLDVFKTLTNVTADLSAATIVSRTGSSTAT
jgi:proton glutamate symport protein